MATHLAAVSLVKGKPFEVQTRPTPNPGPGELLIAVKSVALNPADGYMRDQGLAIPSYPTVIGFDMSGLVIEVGDNVPIDARDERGGLLFRAGVTRVAAYAASYWRACDPDYGAFQERCLVPWQHAVPLPDEGISWNKAATLPVAVEVPLNTWDILGIPRMQEPITSSLTLVSAAPIDADVSGGSLENKRRKKNALLIWGASSSVGTMGVQSARLLRENRDSSFAAVYATAGAANHEYIGSLGADRVFDYQDLHVVDAIVSAAREDGLVIRHCFLAMGQLTPCQAVLHAFLGDDREEENEKAKIGSAPPIPPDAKEVDGIETTFVLPSMNEGERLAQFRYWMGSWLAENLTNGSIRPSPEMRVVGKSLRDINAGLDMLLRGVMNGHGDIRSLSLQTDHNDENAT